MWNQNSSCSEIHTVFFFRKGTLKVEICKWHGFSSCKIKIVLEAPQRSDLAIRERDTNFGFEETKRSWQNILWFGLLFSEKKLFWDHGLLFSVDKMLWLFFLQWTKCCGLFLHPKRAASCAQHYPPQQIAPAAHRVFLAVRAWQTGWGGTQIVQLGEERLKSGNTKKFCRLSPIQ